MLYFLHIPAGTKVLSETSNSLVELIADVYISDAIRQEDGGFIYTTAGRRYYTSAGCCTFKPTEPTGPVIHKNGLVALG